MKLKDIGDMEEYLESRCYCPHEIYDYTGFFYNLFYPDQECVLIGKYDAHDRTFTYVVADNEYGIAQIVCILLNGDIVEDCVRFDATENNIEQIKKRINGEIDGLFSLDEYQSTNVANSLEEIFKIADLIMVT